MIKYLQNSYTYLKLKSKLCQFLKRLFKFVKKNKYKIQTYIVLLYKLY